MGFHYYRGIPLNFRFSYPHVGCIKKEKGNYTLIKIIFKKSTKRTHQKLILKKENYFLHSSKHIAIKHLNNMKLP